MEKITVYGLPLNPMPKLEALRGASFCVSYGTRKKLGAQLDQAIDLVGHDGILLVDNGAYSAWQSGINTMTDEAYLGGFADWANAILDRCPQAIVVLPDIIDGTHEQNWQLACEMLMVIDLISDDDSNHVERVMPIWHMHEPISYLLHLCESFGYVGIGSSGEYAQPGTKAWHARMREAFAAIDKWEADGEGAYIRPRIHLMRAQAEAHKYPVDSSDSCNVAMNHNRQLEKSGENIAAFAARVDRKIQTSAGPEAEHQIKRPLRDYHTEEFAVGSFCGLEVRMLGKEQPAHDNSDGLDIPAFLRRAA